MTINLNEQQMADLGRKIIELFDLRPIRHGDQKGRYDTSYGTKTELGIGSTVARIVRGTVENANRVAAAAANEEPAAGEKPDIYYKIWGYEQTNVDFYQAVKVSDKTVTFRQLKSVKTYAEPQSHTGTIVPLPDTFIDTSEPFRVRFDAFEKLDDKLVNFYYLNKSYQLWDGKPMRFSEYG